MEQKRFDKNSNDIIWKLAPYPRNESFIKLEIGEEFTGTFVASKDNPNFKDERIHVFEDSEGNIRQINGTINLDKWMSVIEPGVFVKVKRMKDKKIGKPNPLQIFEVYIPNNMEVY